MRLNHLIFNASNKILQPYGTKASAAAGVSLGFSPWFQRSCCQGQSDWYVTSCQSLIHGTAEGKGREPLPRDSGLRRQSCAGL